MWDYFLIFIFIVVIIGLIAWSVYLGSENNKTAWTNRQMPFGQMYWNTSTNSTNNLTFQPLSGDNAGTTQNQITCPAGTKINIIGAYFQTLDPYGQCNPNGPSNVLVETCQDPANATSPLCLNTNTNFQNEYCNCLGSNYQDCKIRNATYYVGSKCNGLQTCPLNTSEFGPLPGLIDPSTDPTTYSKLPNIPGSSTNSDGDPQTVPYLYGYYVHGIYTCDPE